jgi:TonB family protein
MLGKSARIMQRYSLWLVILCHFLLFAGFSFVWVSAPKLIEEKERPSLYIPSYVYHNETAPVTTPLPKQENTPLAKPAEKPVPVTETAKTLPISNNGIEKPTPAQVRQSLNINHPIDISRSPETEPVHLIGDKKMDKPLLTLLGKALTAHLVYPKSAIDLNVRGTSIIGFVLYPNGQVSNVQLLRTSRAEVLDRAALAAANAIAPVGNVAKYLNKPKFMVIGIIFE